MSKFISTKNKLSTISNQVQENQNTVDDLKRLSLKNQDNVFIPKVREIILAENVEGNNFDTEWEGTYQFNNLNPKYLHYLQPYSILTIPDAYQKEDYSVTLRNGDKYWWEEYNISNNNDNNTLILHCWVHKGFFIPITIQFQTFLTVKINIYNPSLFKKMTWKKI